MTDRNQATACTGAFCNQLLHKVPFGCRLINISLKDAGVRPSAGTLSSPVISGQRYGWLPRVADS
ncbi:hypothetical protein [Erwinia mallotivora]|uniref:hypothetical protein n=1 Tax=Erwinia mallotivora TaxID=69222 RepID=UPI0012680F78|nr:hypothetical protein [Erwinia mallotivora]